ncbi:MAG: DNA primase [Pseudomonadota bacterium]
MAGRIPQSFIDDLVARADIVEVLGSRMELRKAGREYKGLCPFHGEKTPSFTVSPGKGFYHCFGCGAHGTALGFLMEHDHLTFVDAVEELASMMSIDVPREAGGAPRDSRIDQVFTMMERLADLYSKALRDHPPAIDYLKRRGIDGDTARDFRIGYAPDAWDTVIKAMPEGRHSIELLVAAGMIIERDNGGHYDRFRDRIMFPIRDARGRIVGFGGRVLDQGEPKYLNSPETVLFHKGRELYGLYEARQKLRDITQLVVVEGYMDVVGLARHGVRFAVATLGTATTGDHIDRLFRLTDKVVFSFDGDRAGRKAAWRAMENALPKLTDGRELRFAFMPDGQDPDSLVVEHGVGAFETRLDAALPLSAFLIGELSAQVDVASAEGKAKLAEMARPLVASMQGGVFRELIVQALADAVSLAPEKLDSMMGAATEAAKKPSRRTVQPASNQRSNAMRRAITLLLHQPSGARHFDLAALEHLTRPGAELLKALVGRIQEQPDISSAVLLEQFRDHPHFNHLQKLAAAETENDPHIDIAAEMPDHFASLVRTARYDRLEFLRGLESEGELDDAAKDEMTLLLKQKARQDTENQSS